MKITRWQLDALGALDRFCVVPPGVKDLLSRLGDYPEPVDHDRIAEVYKDPWLGFVETGYCEVCGGGPSCTQPTRYTQEEVQTIHDYADWLSEMPGSLLTKAGIRMSTEMGRLAEKLRKEGL